MSDAAAHRRRRARAARRHDRRRALPRRAAAALDRAAGCGRAAVRAVSRRIRCRSRFPADASEQRVDRRRARGTWWEQTALRTRGRAATGPTSSSRRPTPRRLACAAARGHDSRRLVRRAPGMVPAARRCAAPVADRARSAARRVGRLHRFGVLDERRDRLRVCTSPLEPASGSRSSAPGVSPRIAGRRRAGSPDAATPLVLFVGSMFNRRRLPDLIAAFARATADMPDARLVIVGDEPHLAAAGSRRRSRRAHGVGDRGRAAQLRRRRRSSRDLYARASVFAFLSEYEGFGLTPLEALAAGVPIVVLDTPVAREVYGAAAEYVPPRRHRRDCRGALSAAVSTRRRRPRDSLRTRRRRPRPLSWDDAAARDAVERIERTSPIGR